MPLVSADREAVFSRQSPEEKSQEVGEKIQAAQLSTHQHAAAGPHCQDFPPLPPLPPVILTAFGFTHQPSVMIRGCGFAASLLQC